MKPSPCSVCSKLVIKHVITAPSGRVFEVLTAHVCQPTRRIVTKEGIIIVQ